MKLFVCIYDDARLLPGFLQHYARFGVDEFHVAVPDNLAPQVGGMSRGYDVHLHRDLDVTDSFLGGVSAVTRMRELHQDEDESVVIVDLDEFVEFGGPVDAVVAAMKADGANVTRGIMFDRFAMDGQPKPITETSDLPALFPVRARFTKEVMGGVDFKGVVVRGRLESRGAHHIFADERVASQVLDISHYKWNDRALERVKTAYEMLSAQDIHWAWQYKNVLDHYEAHGRFAWQTFGGEIVEHQDHGGPAMNAPRIRSVDLAAAPAAMREAELAAVDRVLDSGSWILGDEVTAFESEWATACGTSDAVGTGNGHDALEIGLRALSLGLGDEVIAPAMTAFATVLAIIRAGCTPVLADIDPETALLDRASAERCLTPRTRAVMLVHLYGQVGDLPAWREWAASHEVYLIEDCAQAHLAAWDGLTAGAAGAFGAYSFYPTKNLAATGDAGAIVTSDQRLVRKSRRLRDYGRTPSGHHVDVGTNSRLDELQAALLRSRLPWLREFTERRRAIASAYRAGLTNPAVKLLPPPGAPERHVYHQFVVCSERRDDLSDHLAGRGIQTLVHYPQAIHQEKLTRGIRRDPRGLRNAQQHARRCLSLPCHPALTDGDVNAVVEAVNDFS